MAAPDASLLIGSRGIARRTMHKVRAGREPERPVKKAAVRASRPVGPAAVLQKLQRLVGNRAVSGVLGGPQTTTALTVQRGAFDDADKLRAMGQKVRLVTRASTLDEKPEAELKAEVAKMSLPEVKEMLAVVPLTSMHRIRAELLSRMYNDAADNDRWKDAIYYLNGFSDPDIIERINRVKDSFQKRRDLIVAALDNPRILNLIRAATGKKIDEKQPFGEFKYPNGFQVATGVTRTAGTMNIEFVPNREMVNADAIAFVQSIRRVVTGSNSTERYGFGMGDRATDKGTTIDRYGKKKSGFFGYEDTESASGPSTVPGPSVKQGSCKPGSEPESAKMSDSPEKVNDTENTFEACAVAKSGNDTGRVYGCVVWGFTVDDNDVVTPKEVQIQVKASSEFETAARNWNTQAGGGSGNVPGQEKLPDLK